MKKIIITISMLLIVALASVGTYFIINTSGSDGNQTEQGSRSNNNSGGQTDGNTDAGTDDNTGSGSGGNTETPEPPLSDEFNLSAEYDLILNNFELNIDAATNNLTYDAPQLTTEFSNSAEFLNYSTYYVFINDQKIENPANGSFELDQITKGNTIKISITNQTQTKSFTFYLRHLPNHYNNTLTGQGTQSGFYYITQKSYIYKMDNLGNIVFYKFGGDNTGGGDVAEFEPWQINGQVYYTYLGASTLGESKINGVGYYLTKGVVMDSTYNVIKEIEYLYPTNTSISKEPLENHEFVMLGENHFIYSTYKAKTVTNVPAELYKTSNTASANVVACIVQEVKNDQVVNEWDITEYPVFYGYSVENNNFGYSSYQDYFHLNSIVIDPLDNNLIISARNVDSVIKLHRTTGDLMWVLGGKGDQFGLTASQKFSHQHNAVISADGILTIFDNGNATKVSRILKFNIDQTNKTISNYNAFIVSGYFSDSMGGTQLINSETNTFVTCWGNNAKKMLFGEYSFNSDGSVIKHLEVKVNNHTAYSFNCYRVHFHTF